MGRLTSVQTEVNGEAQLLRKQQSPVQQLSPSGSAEEQIEAVIRMLMNHKDLVRKVRQLEQELEGKVLEIKELKEAHDRMKKDLEQVQGVNEDYKALVQIMERARKMAFLNEEEPVKAIFKMDENGNLERVEK